MAGDFTFRWNDGTVRRIAVTAVPLAHARAATVAAGAAARAIRSTYSGGLARDLSIPKPTSPWASRVGSERPYAGIEDTGGVIHAKGGRMLIHDRRTGAAGQATRSNFGGRVVASATSVPHPAKHWRAAAIGAYGAAILVELRRAIGGA